MNTKHILKTAYSKRCGACGGSLEDKLKPYKFDVAVDVQGRLITGLVLLASGAPIRLGLGGTKELNWLFTNYKIKAKYRPCY